MFIDLNFVEICTKFYGCENCLHLFSQKMLLFLTFFNIIANKLYLRCIVYLKIL